MHELRLDQRLQLNKTRLANVQGATCTASGPLEFSPGGTAEITEVVPGTASHKRKRNPRRRCFLCISNSPQKRHPERSASQIYRVTQRLMARSRRTPRVLIVPMPLGPFQPPKPTSGGPATVFPIPSSKILHRPGDGRCYRPCGDKNKEHRDCRESPHIKLCLCEKRRGSTLHNPSHQGITKACPSGFDPAGKARFRL